MNVSAFGAPEFSDLMNVSASGAPEFSDLMNISAFGAPEFSDSMNASAKEILAILNAAVLPVLPVPLCCCAVQVARNLEGHLEDSLANPKEF